MLLILLLVVPMVMLWYIPGFDLSIVDCCYFDIIRVRKAEERQKKEEELRRLKNLKREEIRKRLQAIQEMSGGALVNDGGGGAEGAGEDAQALIEGDFDPQQ